MKMTVECWHSRCSDAESPKNVYWLMQTAFSYKVEILADSRAVIAEPVYFVLSFQ